LLIPLKFSYEAIIWLYGASWTVIKFLFEWLVWKPIYYSFKGTILVLKFSWKATMFLFKWLVYKPIEWTITFNKWFYGGIWDVFVWLFGGDPDSDEYDPSYNDAPFS
jgi:hypothetical protein